LPEIRLRVQRFDPSHDKKPAFREYVVPATRAMTVLDALLHAKSYLDHSIAVRYSCRMSSCGSCGMKIDGKPKLACETQVSGLGSPVVTVQPMDNLPIIRDLVVDMDAFFAHHREIVPHIERDDTVEQEHPTGEYGMRPEELQLIQQFTYCIKCGLCTSACPTAATDSLFPGPQALAQAYRYLMDTRDEDGAERLARLDTQHGVYRCHFAGSCSAVCPKGVDPSLGIQLLRRHVMGAKAPHGRGKGAKVIVNPNPGLLGPP
jgi:succinate dehydrogenase / fumarate reductase iron-sulfur subunit